MQKCPDLNQPILLVILATALELSRGEVDRVKRNVGRMGVRSLHGEYRWQRTMASSLGRGLRNKEGGREGGAHYCMKLDLESLLRFHLPIGS